MDHPFRVRVIQRVGDLANDERRLRDAQLPLANNGVAQGLAFHVRHDVEEEIIHLIRVEQREDVRMTQSRGDLSLTTKPRRALFAHGFGEHHLEGDQAMMLLVAREVDDRHSTPSQLTLDGIASGEVGRQSVEDVCHCAGEGKLETIG